MKNHKSEIINHKSYSAWLHRFACLLVVGMFVLLVSGGNVTSRDAGLAVPGGFWVFDYFLWTFPIDQWVGNIKHEHIHRLIGSAIGLISFALAIGLWRSQSGRPWLRHFGWLTFAMVVLQGVLGIVRVDFVNWLPALATPFAVLHGITGQIVLCMTVLLAAATNRLWIEHRKDSPTRLGRSALPLRGACIMFLLVLLIQLALGAVMRHTGAGLAIPDFPSSYGRVLPPLTQQGLDDVIYAQPYDNFVAAVTPAQVAVHFAHRLWALAVLAAGGWLLTKVAQVASDNAALRGPMWAIIVLLLLQIVLGAAVIWTGRIPDVATAHQATGAAILATAALMTFRIYLFTDGSAAQREPLQPPVSEANVSWETMGA